MTFTASMMIVPRMKVALIRRLKPLFKPLRSSSVHCQVLMTESGAKSQLRMYPPASPEPMACTGDHANQLHHTDTGATSLLYRTQAIAPYTEVPPALCGNSRAIPA